jgi:hypothetical protein
VASGGTEYTITNLLKKSFTGNTRRGPKRNLTNRIGQIFHEKESETQGLVISKLKKLEK